MRYYALYTVQTFLSFRSTYPHTDILLFGLMLLSAILETGGIGLIIPIISVIVEPQIIERNQWLLQAN